EEDHAANDITSGALPLADVAARGTFLVKAEGTLAGTESLQEINRLAWLKARGPNPIKVDLLAKDGDRVQAGRVVATLESSADVLIRLERSMLNLISHLSGVASLTAKFVDAIRGTKAQICDTRKTIVGLRVAQKYAVACGGGINHRFALHDEAMIKENHLALSGMSIADAIAAIRANSNKRLTCECENLEQVQEALDVGADCLLLDNFSNAMLEEALMLRKRCGRDGVPFEASGGVTLETVADIAATGVDRISIGALTHSAPSLDISFKIHPL
ncbi:MAG: carboxylating nicotinate-nucleotide diphosphorylase, partial [Planctomycetes bacterium]|nr:carboxylating nicotinate-nucleotide diphosphorylase [Planctomycetota bacterium]